MGANGANKDEFLNILCLNIFTTVLKRVKLIIGDFMGEKKPSPTVKDKSRYACKIANEQGKERILCSFVVEEYRHFPATAERPDGWEEKTQKSSSPLFLFTVQREKSQESKRERLRITAEDAMTGEESGTITATMSKLMDGLMGLLDYGVVLPRSAFGVVAQEIEERYREFPVEHMIFEDELPVDDIYELFMQYITEQGLQPTKVANRPYKCYNISNENFAAVLNGSEYRGIEPATVKKAFAERKYIRTNAGRLDVNVPGEKGRFVSFYAPDEPAQEADESK